MAETDVVRCPHCGNVLVPPAGPRFAGQTMSCTVCGQTVAIGPPAPGVAPGAPALAAAAPPPQPAYSPPGVPTSPLGYGVPPPKSSGKKVLLIVLVCLLAAAVPFCACMVSILLPSLNRAREQANRVKCASNLRMIGQGIQMYANENRGQFPDTMERILTTQDLTAEMFVCPSSSDTAAPGANLQAQAANLSKGGHLSYVYVGKGMSMNMNPSTMGDVVLAYEPMTNHNNDGSNFLFADGHVEFFGKGQAAQIITDVQAGTNPPRAKASPGY